MKKLFFSTVIGLLALASCSSNDRGSEPAPVNPSASVKTQEVKDVDATDRAKYTLYSLRENKVIAATEQDTDKWDIGFSGTTIIINGGSVRKGKGAAAIIKGTSFDAVKTAPEDAMFKVDNGIKNPDLAIETGSTKGWYTYADTRVTPIAGNIIVIKTGDSKYAKIQITSYYKGAPATISDAAAANDSAYYNFKFALQTDGSKTFSK
ncbi:HmuY family protein [Elizabethkingia meningoseptica]|uniref:HmuY family protein n=1 Tax=Elizabethkingia meningoseptica TaxID=238 RepID=UPI0009994E6B|nr:HmuY family protein [Elizabethkingia meningoseptica]EJK5330748.1 HmuY family protein [Elizabethkingia meningoseptica]MDE5432773.1 HmuY family protein [Elizabethkingia meningoseptica]MDE5469800.1 HmuY family protein [Elizabethkingia meningoseptica]MDE5476746.1 HmuY family protein [Elizabethkingia meningoseptica]MDE5480145.1 HmuY family protein [Elizabethkingia meningoseptica]